MCSRELQRYHCALWYGCLKPEPWSRILHRNRNCNSWATNSVATNSLGSKSYGYLHKIKRIHTVSLKYSTTLNIFFSFNFNCGNFNIKKVDKATDKYTYPKDRLVTGSSKEKSLYQQWPLLMVVVTCSLTYYTELQASTEVFLPISYPVTKKKINNII